MRKKIIALAALALAAAPVGAFAATLYFNGAANSNWATLGNWWDDAGFTDPAAAIPTASDDAVISAQVSANSGPNVTVATLVANAGVVSVSATSTGGATFNGSSGVSLATLTGDAVFNDSSSNSGIVSGNATFNGSSSNDSVSFYPSLGRVTGDAVFNDTSNNRGYVAGDATFNDSSWNIGHVAGDATFTYASGGAIALSGTMVWGTFGGATLDALGNPITSLSFGDSSTNYGTTTGDATFTGSSRNCHTSLIGLSVPTPCVVAGDATFSGASYNAGTVQGDATFDTTYYSGTAPSGGVLTVSGTSRWYGRVQGTVYGADAVPVTTFLFEDSATISTGAVATGTATFSGSSQIDGTLNGDASFTDSSYVDNVLNGDATFWDSSSNRGRVEGGSVFYGASVNRDTLNGDAVFLGTSSNEGTVNGDACFGAGAANSGTVTGAVTVCEEVAPTLSSAIVDGAAVALSYSETLDAASAPATSTFTVLVDGVPATVSSVAVSGSTVTVTLAAAATAGQTVSLSYTTPVRNPLRDAGANLAADLSAQSVTNATAADSGPRHSSSGRRGGGGGGGSSPRSGSSAGGEGTGNLAAAPDGDADFPYPHSSREAAQNLASVAARDLWLGGGSRGLDVRALQIFLNTSGFTLAADGPGSPGEETEFFGSLTRAALARWQAAHGVVPAVGYYGPITRAAIAAEATGL